MQRENYIKWIIRLSLLVLLFLCAWLLLKLAPFWAPVLTILKAVLFPFFIAVFITYLLHPLVEILHRKGMPRTLSILCIYLLFFGGTGYALYKGIPYMILQIRELASNLPTISKTYQSWLLEVDHHTASLPKSLHLRIEEYIHSGERYLQKSAANVIGSIKKLVDYFFVLIIIPFLVFYFLKDIEGIKRVCWYLTPQKWRREGRQVLKEIDCSLGGYIRGQLFVGTLLGAAAMLALWLAGMPYPIILGIIIAITDIIPYFGPILGAVPVIFIAFTISVKMVFVVAGIMLVLQFIEGNILGPLIVGKSLHIHPALIILALLAGGEIGGVAGLILAVPVFSIMKVIIVHIRNHRLQAKIDKMP
ncbi:Predicted PurR-regulated permease PerM [Fictibacillus solisalsi]|uniref:Predicted PurR-regulated permease PerM n=1 Tax=Fictibacillus solisalsi TaxID=459525 RepID=A0A1G9WP31_9BACL|nr:AI-2E family transporter [Fictibacillus solisalsi]SDM86312.1 Predicted PurR-regulated permease PerM [Fictibacillus solisalsi]